MSGSITERTGVGDPIRARTAGNADLYVFRAGQYRYQRFRLGLAFLHHPIRQAAEPREFALPLRYNHGALRWDDQGRLWAGERLRGWVQGEATRATVDGVPVLRWALPAGGSLPVTIASIASQIRSASGGQPGR